MYILYLPTTHVDGAIQLRHIKDSQRFVYSIWFMKTSSVFYFDHLVIAHQHKCISVMKERKRSL